jgi:hypothetical protein
MLTDSLRKDLVERIEENEAKIAQYLKDGHEETTFIDRLVDHLKWQNQFFRRVLRTPQHN